MKFTVPKVVWCICTLLASMIVPANAAVQQNDTTEINLSVFIPCAAGGAGETVDLTAQLHTLIKLTINGNNVSGFFHYQPQGIACPGETTGEKYQATGI